MLITTLTRYLGFNLFYFKVYYSLPYFPEFIEELVYTLDVIFSEFVIDWIEMFRYRVQSTLQQCDIFVNVVYLLMFMLWYSKQRVLHVIDLNTLYFIQIFVSVLWKHFSPCSKKSIGLVMHLSVEIVLHSLRTL